MKNYLYCLLLVAPAVLAQQPAADPGSKSFEVRCSVCHGGDGNGSPRAPSLISFVGANPDAQIAALIRSGVRAMPPHDIADTEMTGLLAFLHTLRPAAGADEQAARVVTVTLDSGATMQGRVLNESNFGMQIAAADGSIHSLVRSGDVYREPSLLPKLDWPRYDGSFTGNRHSPLDQINTANVAKLKLAWMFPVNGAPRIEATPVVVDGVMYVTTVNAAYALDAVTGRRLWNYQRPRTPGLLGEAAGGANRGVAIAGNRVFMMTDNAHLLALDKGTGKLLWDTTMTDWPKSQYSASGAPLVVGEHVIAGVAGGEEGTRGFVASYRPDNGELEWQFWTIPKPGEKLSETWVGSALEHGCGATWMSGSYDPELDLLYWAVGNPCPDFNGADRKGDNLYTNSVLALKPATGQLSWYYQYTPHDTHDWDADEPLVLADETFEGRPRKLLIQASRNGFFFVLDRVTGEFLRATPFSNGLNWATGYTSKGRPIQPTNTEPTLAGSKICPGAGTNWMSASYISRLKLFIFSADDRCGLTKLVPAPFEMGKRFFNGTGSYVPESGGRSIRALDLRTGKAVWNYWQTPGGRSASGTVSTDGGLVFFGEDSGAFTALDAVYGKPLWHFPVNDSFRASPMTYMVGGKQYVTIAAAAGFMTFALSDEDAAYKPPPPPERPTPPTRSPDVPSAPQFTRLDGRPGVNPPADVVGNFVIGPDYLPAPELSVVPGVPQGKVLQFTMESKDSKFYNPGIGRDVRGTIDPANPNTLIIDTHPTEYQRTITVYIPAQYVPGTRAPFIVTHDGPALGKPDMNLPHVLDNLIAQKRVPVQIAVMIAHGGGDGQGSERGREYDTMSGKYAEFIETEVLPLVEKNYGVKLTRDPEARATMGNSSGGAAALIMAWYHPELYRRVITTSGTFVNQQWPFNSQNPGGAWDFHSRLIPQSPKKPIRLWMGVADTDLLSPNVMRDNMHDWVEANHHMANMLAAKGYRYQYVFARGVTHGMGAARLQILPEALEWVWKDYKRRTPPTR